MKHPSILIVFLLSLTASAQVEIVTPQANGDTCEWKLGPFSAWGPCAAYLTEEPLKDTTGATIGYVHRYGWCQKRTAQMVENKPACKLRVPMIYEETKTCPAPRRGVLPDFKPDTLYHAK